MEPKLTFEIPNWRWNHVKKKLDALVRRAGKKGLTHFTYNVDDEKSVKSFRRQVPVTLEDMPCESPFKWESYDVECVVVTINCPRPSLNGWSFVGRIEHMKYEETGETVNLVYAAPGLEVPAEFHHRDRICEHCNTLRFRRDTFIVVKGDEYKQVGSTCLADFLGVDASSMLAYAEIVEGALSICSDPDDFTDGEWGMMRQSHCYSLREIVRVAAAITLNSGYVSRKAADESYKTPTSEYVRNYILAKTTAERDRIIPRNWWTDQVTQLTEDTLNWLRDLASEDFNSLGDYLRNLVAVVKINRCPWKAIGILGSAPYSLLRNREREQKVTDAAKSQHQGNIKERITRNVTVILARTFESFNSTGVIYKFSDNDGNRYLWFASSNQGWEVGQSLTIIGTVKAHDTDKYEGNCPVTIINRVKEK